jgi:hypothetical protein
MRKLLCLIAALLLATPAFTGEFGYSDTTGFTELNLEGTSRVTRAECVSGGDSTAVKIIAFITHAGDAVNIKGALYLWGDSTLVAITEARSIDIDKTDTIHLSFVAPPTLTAPTEYGIAVWAETSGSATMTACRVDRGEVGVWYWYDVAAYGAWPDPYDPDALVEDYNFVFRVVYSPGAAESAAQMIMVHDE